MTGDVNGLTLQLILTAGGAVAAALLIAGFIELFKKLPVIGPAIDAGREPAVAFLFSALLVILAYAAYGPFTPEGAFAAFLAFYGIASIAMQAHDHAALLTTPSDGDAPKA